MTKDSKTNKARQERYMNVLQPIFERAGRACATKGQTHLQKFEVTR
jgi:hypothetical protein